eukprot:8324108-Pyramimonas_sp.AAC.2
MAPIASGARSASSPSVLLPPPPLLSLPSSPLSGASQRGPPRILSRQHVGAPGTESKTTPRII